MTRPLSPLGRRLEKPPAHPGWCAGGHHCTATRRSDGEHASVPEVFRTDAGRIVATRYRRADDTRDRVEIRTVVDLDTFDEASAQEQARMAIVAVHLALTSPESLAGAR